MEVLEVEIPYKRSDIFELHPLGDIHLGSPACQEDDLEKYIATEISPNKNAYVIGMGDYTDCITKNDKRFDIEGLADWVERDNIIESQRRKVVEILKPLAQKGKLLGLLAGNHEEEIHKQHQDDIIRNICKDLSVPYAGYSCFLVLNFKRFTADLDAGVSTRQYVIHAWHGAGSSQTEGARLMRLMRLVNDFQAHIYLMGHLHAITSYTPERMVYQRGRVKSVRLIATTTGSWLKTYSQPKGDQHFNPSYGEMKGYKPSRIGCPVIHLCPDKDWFTVES